MECNAAGTERCWPPDRTSDTHDSAGTNGTHGSYGGYASPGQRHQVGSPGAAAGIVLGHIGLLLVHLKEICKIKRSLTGSSTNNRLMHLVLGSASCDSTVNLDNESHRAG
ncbi:hypothetical protein pipiens_008094 [Culex pipiens pipiens]|uniref:Uncharacterized protein n=1 Tax=Culex pipiens pipiens TaxID=38569 RepID=A0ABD1DK21_CULPP